VALVGFYMFGKLVANKQFFCLLGTRTTKTLEEDCHPYLRAEEVTTKMMSSLILIDGIGVELVSRCCLFRSSFTV